MDLMKLDLVLGDRNTGAIKDDETRTGGTLVNGTDEAIFEVVRTTGLILQQRAIAVVGLIVVDVHPRLLFLLFDRTFDLAHIKRILHFACGVGGGGGCGGGWW